MSRPRVGIYKQIGNGRQGTIKARSDLLKVRQLASMVTWLLVKIVSRANLLIYQGNPTELDGEIQDKLRAAVRAAAEVEAQISWCCNASELKTKEEKANA